MNRTVEVAFVALVLLGSSLGTALPAAAEVNISVDPGSIAFGYSDGYWDRDHHWHAWRNRNDAEWYRSHDAQHYVDRRHDQEREQGWHGEDRWWDHH